MPTVECENCGKKVERYPSNIKNTKHLFCSKGCYGEWMKKRKKKFGGQFRDLKEEEKTYWQRKKWLKKEYVDKRRTMKDIGEDVGVDTSTVRYWIRKYGFDTRDNSVVAQIKNHTYGLKLTEKEVETIEGLLLGDGSIQYKGAYKQPCVNKDYLEFVLDRLPSNLFTDTYPRKEHDEERYEQGYIWIIASRVHPELTKIRGRWYDGKGYNKEIPSDFKLTPTKLLHWYLGDGYYSPDKNTPSITTTFKNYQLILDQLSKIGFKYWTVKQRRSDKRREEIQINIRPKQREKFFDYIGPPPVKSYEYKWGDCR